MNEFGPPFEIEHRDSTNTKVIRTDKQRWQHIGIALDLVNIGGERAENVSFELSGPFKRNDDRGWPTTFGSVIKQFAPGQSLHLMQLQSDDLEDYEYKEVAGGAKVGRPVGMKKETFTITVHYDGPSTWLNRLSRWFRHRRGLKQFSSTFIFDPTIFHELPPPKYNG